MLGGGRLSVVLGRGPTAGAAAAPRAAAAPAGLRSGGGTSCSPEGVHRLLMLVA